MGDSSFTERCLSKASFLLGLILSPEVVAIRPTAKYHRLILEIDLVFVIFVYSHIGLKPFLKLYHSVGVSLDLTINNIVCRHLNLTLLQLII